MGGASAGGGGEDGAAAAADGMDPEWEAVTMDDGSVYYQHKEHTFITSYVLCLVVCCAWLACVVARTMCAAPRLGARVKEAPF